MASKLKTGKRTLARRGFLLAAAAFVGTPANAQVPSGADAADVARVEAYLATIRTLDSRFLQIGPDGSVAEGRFLLARPGRLRLEYDAPNPNLLVSDGRAFVHIDKSLRTIAYLPIDSTPAGLLVRAEIRLAGDVTVVGVERSPAALRMTLIQTKDPRAGRLVLTFADRPLTLVGWSVIDSQGLNTRLTLVDAKFGAELDATAFAFVDPNVPTGGSRP
ncbi:MAG: LolA family protein [Rhodospirillales bacterium]|jgi:outer membrane lipoprotein-sorting protein